MAHGGWFRSRPRNGATQATVPDGLWLKCPRCNEILFARDVERNFNVCPKCNFHHRLSVQERLAITVDEGSFEELDPSLTCANPLAFPDYSEKLTRDRLKTGHSDAFTTGLARIENHPVVIGIADFSFMGGSMGSVVGERIARAMEYGARRRIPVVFFTASGGARMQEGLISLMQMAKTSAAAALLDRAGVPYIVVLTNPTTGGVYASYASLGDIVLAEPGATVAFAGRRVGNQDLGMKLPDDFQTSEFQYRCGMIDQVTPRRDIRTTLGRLLGLLREEAVHAE